MPRRAVSLAAALAIGLSPIASAATSSSSTVGCTALVTADTQAIGATIAADNKTITAPQPITQLTCLSSFFNGSGVNLITNLFSAQEFTNVLHSIEGQICASVNSAWQNAISNVGQCGIALTGFNLSGFNPNLGFGNFCPSLHFGGGGATIGGISAGIGGSNGTGLFVNGTTMLPAGYGTGQGAVTNVP